jgi:hypothetical protein
MIANRAFESSPTKFSFSPAGREPPGDDTRVWWFVHVLIVSGATSERPLNGSANVDGFVLALTVVSEVLSVRPANSTRRKRGRSFVDDPDTILVSSLCLVKRWRAKSPRSVDDTETTTLHVTQC